MHHRSNALRAPRRIALTLLVAALLTPTLHAQWELEDSRTTADLRGIHALGVGIAWASGTHGTVLRTEDGGYLWQGCATPPGAENLDFRGIQAFDENTAIVMSSGPGDLSRLYQTTNGCRTWKLLLTNPDPTGFWDALRFDDQVRATTYSQQHANGVLVGDPVKGVFAIFTTSNGGETWTRWNGSDQKHLPKAKNGESLFAASNQSVVAPGSNGPFAFVTGGTESTVYVAQPHSPLDNGVWFSLSSAQLRFPSSQTAGAFAIAARRSPDSPFADLMVVGGDYQRANDFGSSALVSGPRPIIGGSQVSQAQTPPHGYRSSVAYDPNHNTWITVGPNGTDISRDDGKNWTALTPTGTEPKDADQHWNALSLPFAVGPHGRIGKLRPSSLGPGALPPKATGAKP